MLSKKSLKKYFKQEYFLNRDLSWLEFNRRVLEEATNPDSPLLERIKFISIFFTNLDEFYMIRVAGLKERIRSRVFEPSIDGLTPAQELAKIEEGVKLQLNEILSYWSEVILPELEANNILIKKLEELEEDEREALRQYFQKEIYPVLIPLAFDPGRPFPYISNLSLSFAILVVNGKGERHFARVKIPNILPRLIRIDKIVGSKKNKNGKGKIKFIWVDDLIKNNLTYLFPGLKIVEAHKFRITRDTDLEIQEDEADDLLELIEENVKQRKFGSVVRLEVEKDMPDFLLEILIENLGITTEDVQVIDGPVGLADVIALSELPLPHLKDKPFNPVTPIEFEEKENIFSLIKQKDILLHHPYDSFKPVVDFIKEAAQDPDVLAIKQTLYRVGSNSPVVKDLIEAAERNKQVIVLVELKARFDEENNIYWARELEKSGVHVVYGLVGLKTHAKMTLVVRRESDGVKRYAHVSTGNYNPVTARIYTDFGLFTANEDICSDLNEVFNSLTGYSEKSGYRKLLVAPFNMRNAFLKLIEREIKNVQKGKGGKLIFKMNSLVDPHLIAAMYEASAQGVEIDLLVRGICSLKPGVPGLSENIRARSIVGRFLEHSRIFYFYNGGKEEIYLGSADLMQRNLDRRVEIVFPIEDFELKEKLKKILEISFKDNVKARIMLPDGRYVMNHRVFTQPEVSLQNWLMEEAAARHLKEQRRKRLGN